MASVLETKELFIRDPLTINIMTPEQRKIIQKCVEKSKKKRPLTQYKMFVKRELKNMSNTNLNPKEKIKIISNKWKEHNDSKK